MFPIGPIFAKANEENRQVNPHVDICRSPCAFCAGNSSTSPHTVECEQSHTCEVLKHLVSFRDQPMWHELLENCRKKTKKMENCNPMKSSNFLRRCQLMVILFSLWHLFQ